MREIRMSGSVGRGLRPPYPIGGWTVDRGRAANRCGHTLTKLSIHEPRGAEGSYSLGG